MDGVLDKMGQISVGTCFRVLLHRLFADIDNNMEDIGTTNYFLHRPKPYPSR
jgi:hypothetical protein